MNIPIVAKIQRDEFATSDECYRIVIGIGKELKVVSQELITKELAEGSIEGLNWEIKHVLQNWCRSTLKKAEDIKFLNAPVSFREAVGFVL